MVAHLRGAAEELGFVMCLANREYHDSGMPDEEWQSGHKRSRYGGWDDEDSAEGMPMMGEVDETDYTLRNLFDLDDRPALSVDELKVTEDALIPKEPFEDESPEGAEHEGYQGNVRYFASRLDAFDLTILTRISILAQSIIVRLSFHSVLQLIPDKFRARYRWTVLVLFQKSDKLDVTLASGGVSNALRLLKQQGSITTAPDAQEIVDYILRSLSSYDRTTAASLADIALG